MVKLYAPAGSQVVYDQDGAEYAVSNGYIDVPPNAVGGLIARGFVVDPSAALAAMGFYAPKPYRASIAVIGDSHTDRFTAAGFGNYYDHSFLTWFFGVGGFDYSSITKYATSGASATELASQVAAAVAARHDLAIVLMGTNVGTETAAQTVALLSGYYDDLRAVGTFVIACTVPPHVPASGQAAETARINTINKGIKNYWADKKAYGAVADIFAATANSTVVDSPFKTNHAYDTPPTHYSNLGAYWAGKTTAAIATPYLKKIDLPTTSNDSKSVDAASKNMLTSPCFTGTTGVLGAGITGTNKVATGWNTLRSGSATGVADLVDASTIAAATVDWVGIAQKVAWTFTADGEFGYLYSDRHESLANNGDRLFAACKIYVANATALKSLDVYWSDNLGNSYHWGALSGVAAASKNLPATFDLQGVQTQVAALATKTGSTQLRMWVVATGSGAGTADIYVAQAKFDNLGQ